MVQIIHRHHICFIIGTGEESVSWIHNSSLRSSNGISLSCMRNRRTVMKRQKRRMRNVCWAEFIRPCQRGC